MEPRKRSRVARPYRRLRRWERHTPNGAVAARVIAVGVVLVIVAAVLAVVVV